MRASARNRGARMIDLRFMDEFVISWGDVAPLLIPLVSLATMSIWYFYHRLRVLVDDLGDLMW